MLFEEKTLLKRLIVVVLLVLKNVTGSGSSFGMQMVKSPESSVAPEGDEVIFECELSLAPDKFIWRFQSELNKHNEFKYLHKNGEGYNISHYDASSKLRIYVRPSNIGKYQCVAWYGDSAIVSLPANLTLASIQEDNNHYSSYKSVWKVSPGNTVVVRCGSVTSNPPAIWSFYKNGVLIPTSSEKNYRPDSLVLNSVSHLDSGRYSCVAINVITEQKLAISHTIDLRIETSNSSMYFPINPPSVVRAIAGQSALLECVGVGNPPPKTIWTNIRKQDKVTHLPFGLHFPNVSEHHAGTYECILDNGRVPTIKKSITLEVLTKPEIIEGISDKEISVKEEHSETLECKATGFPKPRIYWLINGESVDHDPNINLHENKIIFKTVKKQYAGIIQCFAENEGGEVFQANFLKVIPIVRTDVPITSSHRPTPGFKYTPPSAPIVTKLSDTSVMLQWVVPPNNGLPIQFFKIQYRVFGNINKTRQNWQTFSDQIISHPSRRYTQEVIDLKTDFSYKFRILAVYSNNDNKEGPTSQKFHLHQCTRKNCVLAQPNLKRVEGISESEIELEWDIPHHTKAAEGFYLYYRPVESAGKYLITTISRNSTRKTVVGGLEENTAYEFKIKAFSTTLASEFSQILSGKTNKTVTTAPPTTTTTLPPKEENFKSTIYPIVGLVIGGCTILLLVLTIIFFKFQKRNGNFFKTPADDGTLKPNVNLSNLHHHTHLNLNNKNGASKDQNLRINITSNPLDQQIEV